MRQRRTDGRQAKYRALCERYDRLWERAFMLAWLTLPSHEQIARMMGCETREVAIVAAHFRSEGICLPPECGTATGGWGRGELMPSIN